MEGQVLKLRSRALAALTLALGLGGSVGGARATSWFADLPGGLVDGQAARFVLAPGDAEPSIVLGGVWQSELDGVPELWLVRLDDSGLPVSNLRYGGEQGFVAEGAAATRDGGFVVVGLHGRSPSETGESVLLRFGEDGRLTWQRRLALTGPTTLWAKAVVELTGGKLVVLASLDEGGAAGRFALVGLDSLGQVEWANDLQVAAGDLAEQPLAALSAGGFALAVREHDTGDLLAAFDSDGTRRWSLSTGRRLSEFQAIAGAADGGLMVAGDGGSLMRLSADGSLTWHETTGPTFANWRALRSTASGTWVTVSEEVGGVEGLVLLRFDDSASILGASRFGELGEGRVTTNDIAALPDASLAFTASRSETTESSGMGVIRHDALAPTPECYQFDELSLVTSPGAGGLLAAGLSPVALAVEASPIELTALPVSGFPACTACVPDEHEPDDACGQGLPSNLIAARHASNFCDDSIDVFPIEACAGRSYVFHARAIDTEARSQLRLVGADCSTEIATALPMLDDTDLTWTASTDGLVYLEVVQLSATPGPSTEYELTLSSADPEVYGSQLVESLGDVYQLGDMADGSVGAVSSGASTPASWAAAWTLSPEGLPGWSVSLLGSGSPMDGGVTDSGDVLALGYRSEAGGTWSWLATRFSPTGETRFAVEIEDVSGFARIADSGDGGALVFGTIPSTAGDSSEDLGLVRLDASGGVAWQLSLDVDSLDYAYDLTRDPDGGYLLAASDQGAGIGYWVARIDDLGTLLSSRSLDLGGSAPALYLQPTPDGGALTFGGSPFPSGVAFDASLHLTRLDDAGDLVWAKYATLPEQLYPRDLDQAMDGRIAMMAGRSPSHGTVVPTAVIVRATEEGVAIGSRDLPPSWSWRGAVAWTDSGDVVGSGSAQGLPGTWITRLPGDLGVDPACPELAEWEVIDTGDDAIMVGDIVPTIGALNLTVSPATWTEERSVPAVRAACECGCPADGLAAEVSPVGSPTPLRVTHLADGSGETELSWEPRSQPDACRFNVYRGAVADLRSTRAAGCLLADSALDALTLETEPPPPRRLVLRGDSRHSARGRQRRFGLPRERASAHELRALSASEFP